MKKTLFFSLLVLAFMSCQSETKTEKMSDTAPAATEQSEPKKEEKKKNPGADFTPKNMKQTVAPNSPIVGQEGAAVSLQSERLITALSTDYWVIANYLRMALEKDERRALEKENQNRWFKFSPNGTFVSGKNQETTGGGKYFYDPAGPSLYFDHNDRRDEEWTIKMSSEETVMIWVGTSTFKESGIQAKVENASSMPGAQ